MVRRSFAAVALFVALPNLLIAQDTTRTHRLDTLSVTAERRPTASTATPAVVRVIAADELRAKAGGDLIALLREIPGLQIDPVVGSGEGISIQGLGSDRIQVLVDGAPMEGRLNNQFDLTRLDPSQISRIEIVEGPQSTLYGSTALGGVINLITRAPDGRHAEVTSRGGSYGQFDVSGRVSTLIGGGGLSISAGHRHLDIAPGNAVGTPGSADRLDFAANLIQPMGSTVLNVRAMHTREDQRYQQDFGPGFLFGNDAANRQTDVLATLHTDGDGMELRAHTSVYQHTLDETNIPSSETSTDPQSQRLADLEFLRRGSIGGGVWLAGARVEHEWITTARLTAADESSTSAALFGSAEWKLNDALALSTGARLTSAQRWGNDFAPRVGLVWNSKAGWYAKVGVAHGFRAPSFTEQFSSFINAEAGYAVTGNPDLKAESSWNLTGEIGAHTRYAQAYLRGFGNRLRNFIEASYTGQVGQVAQFTYLNVGQARTSGGEIGGSAARGIATVEGSYAYLDAVDESSDQPLLGRAKHTIRGALTLSKHEWSLTGEAVRTSSAPISQDQQTGALVYQGAAPRVNLRAGVDVLRQWRMNVGVDNVGDVIPENAIAGFGRRWFVALNWRD